MDDKFTLKDLNLLTRGCPTQEITVGLIFANSAQDFLPLVNKAIDWASDEFARTPKERQDRSEDGLSIDLVTTLKALGFNASHDTTVGGHCDVVIEEKFGFLWLGEAKIHQGYDWLLKGFEQLDKRYATANAAQDQGAVIIYCFGKRIDKVMDRWKRHLKNARDDVSFCEDQLNPLGFLTTHTHRRNGQTYTVRHVPVSLLWDPEDISLDSNDEEMEDA